MIGLPLSMLWDKSTYSTNIDLWAHKTRCTSLFEYYIWQCILHFTHNSWLFWLAVYKNSIDLAIISRCCMPTWVPNTVNPVAAWERGWGWGIGIIDVLSGEKWRHCEHNHTVQPYGLSPYLKNDIAGRPMLVFKGPSDGSVSVHGLLMVLD